MSAEKIILWISIIGISIPVICICTIFILVRFNFIKVDENEYIKYNKNKIVEAAEKPYELTDKDIDIMHDAGDGDKVTINGKVYVQHICCNSFTSYITWFDVENLCFVNL